MKIVILQGAFLPIPAILGGAVEKRWYRMGLEFAKLGHEVVHISRSHEDLETVEFINGVNYIRVSGFDIPSSLLKLKYCDLIYSFRALRFIPKDADIIVTNTFWSPILLRGKLGRSVYVDVARVPKGQMRFYKHVGCLRANSTPVAEAIKNELKEGASNFVDLIPNFLSFEVQESACLRKKKKTILYVGRIHPEKGLAILIRAFNLLDTDWKLRIVGPWEIQDGGGGNDYYKSLMEISKSSQITFVGPIYDTLKLNNEYADASLFVYPSVAEKGETFGLAPLEAMAWGCVPIVSSLACFADFIKESVNGTIFNHRSSEAVHLLVESIHSLIVDPDLRNQLAKKALEVNKTHSTKSIALEFLKSFDRVIAKNKR